MENPDKLDYAHVVPAQQGARFQSARGLATAVMVLLSVHAVASLLSALATYSLRSVMERALDGNGFSEHSLIYGFRAAAMLQNLVFIATAVVFLCWLHRSYANLPALNPDSLYGTKGIVVGWFIPFVNFVHGHRTVSDLYIASQPPRPDQAGFGIRGSTAIIDLWWGFYIASNVVSHFGRFGDPLGWATLSELFSIVAGLLCITVVYRVERRQRAQYQDMTLRAAASQPPPSDRLR